MGDWTMGQSVPVRLCWVPLPAPVPLLSSQDKQNGPAFLDKWIDVLFSLFYDFSKNYAEGSLEEVTWA